MNDYPEIVEKEIHLSEYWKVILFHKRLVFLWTVLIVLSTTVVMMKMAPVYQATATMIVDNAFSVSPVTGGQMDYNDAINYQLLFNTHKKMLSSNAVIEKLLDRMEPELAEKKEWASVSLLKRIKEKITGTFRLNDAAAGLADSEEAVRSRLKEHLRNNIKISEVRNTRLLQLSAEDQSPEWAARMANTMAREYVLMQNSDRKDSSRDTLAWLTEQIAATKRRLEEAEEEFQEFKQDEKIFSIEGRQQVIAQKIADFNDVYLETRNRRLELDTILAEIKRITNGEKDILKGRMLIKTDLLDDIYAALIKAEVEYGKLSKIYKSRHPKLAQVRSEISRIQANLKEEVAREINRRKAEREVLYAKEAVLQKTVDDFEKDAMETSRRHLDYTILERNVETNRKLYDALLQKTEEINIEENRDASSIRMAEMALVPLKPVRPKKARNVLLSLIFGIASGIGLAFFREYLDQSIKDDKELELDIGVPILGVIPEAKRP